MNKLMIYIIINVYAVQMSLFVYCCLTGEIGGMLVAFISLTAVLIYVIMVVEATVK